MQDNNSLPAPDLSPEVQAQLARLQPTELPAAPENSLQTVPQPVSQPFVPGQTPISEILFSPTKGVPVNDIANQLQVGRAPAQQNLPPTSLNNPAEQFEPQQKPAENKTQQLMDLQNKLAVDNLQRSYEVQQKSQQALGEYEAQKAEHIANQYEQNTKAIAGRQAAMQRSLAEINNQVDSQIMELQNIGKEITNFEFKTPELKVNSPFVNGTTGQKIMAAIAIALGGIGGALTGRGGNAALDVINAAVKQDLEVQRANIENQQQDQTRKMDNKKAQAGLQQSLLGALRA